MTVSRRVAPGWYARPLQGRGVGVPSGGTVGRQDGRRSCARHGAWERRAPARPRSRGSVTLPAERVVAGPCGAGVRAPAAWGKARRSAVLCAAWRLGGRPRSRRSVTLPAERVVAALVGPESGHRLRGGRQDGRRSCARHGGAWVGRAPARLRSRGSVTLPAERVVAALAGPESGHRLRGGKARRSAVLCAAWRRLGGAGPCTPAVTRERDPPRRTRGRGPCRAGVRAPAAWGEGETVGGLVRGMAPGWAPPVTQERDPPRRTRGREPLWGREVEVGYGGVVW